MVFWPDSLLQVASSRYLSTYAVLLQQRHHDSHHLPSPVKTAQCEPLCLECLNQPALNFIVVKLFCRNWTNPLGPRDTQSTLVHRDPMAEPLSTRRKMWGGCGVDVYADFFVMPNYMILIDWKTHGSDTANEWLCKRTFFTRTWSLEKGLDLMPSCSLQRITIH